MPNINVYMTQRFIRGDTISNRVYVTQFHKQQKICIVTLTVQTINKIRTVSLRRNMTKRLYLTCRHWDQYPINIECFCSSCHCYRCMDENFIE